jgi:N-acetylmuramoyl-L-alanine amidase
MKKRIIICSVIAFVVLLVAGGVGVGVFGARTVNFENSLTLENKTDGVYVDFSSHPDADGYYIYRSDETEKETQILAEVETKTEVVVGQPETEAQTKKPEVEQATQVVVENVTTQPSASAEGNESHQVAESEFVLEFSEEDYKVLCTIVEAEAGDQDAKGRILVANVIINRVKKEGKFGNTIKEVVFANNGKTYQFSPTKPGGRYYKVTADELTIECVDRALRGEDYSQGALYFCMKTSPNSWFNTSLQFLFKHQDHYFYK